MPADRETIIDEAIGWHVRLAESRDDEWTDFIAWLEASPAHAAAYDTVAMEDRLIGDVRLPLAGAAAPAANDNPRRYWRRALGGGAIAATIAALLVPAMLVRRSQPYAIATRPGQPRTVMLADGTSIEISGGTLLRLDRADPRVATLDRGEAVFHVRHDTAHPFAITSAGVTIRDLGTVFNLARDGTRLSVAVSEGSVLFQPDGAGLTLRVGDALTIDERSGQTVRSRMSPDQVGGWRSGVLSFDGQPLGQVAATLNRLYATNLGLEGGLSDRPFTGMVRFTGKADRDVPHLATLIGTKWRREGEGWILSSAAP
ncbi:FecR domain-containing protein [uncultured Sphingomonas sp.]|uniref:FecR family protein n=1 Tax=uncultured Sphingomonas sp. TaxID=158754 RepID=UPI0035CAD567